jgi:hypothetical protein
MPLFWCLLFFESQEFIAANEPAFHMLTRFGRRSAFLAFLDDLKLQPTVFTGIDLAFFHFMAMDHSNLHSKNLPLIITIRRG